MAPQKPVVIHRNFHRLAWLAVVLAFGVIVFGAFVRLSNAGLSCPDWPTCYGRATWPQAAHDAADHAATAIRAVEPHKVWQLAGKDADRVHVLWVGALPQGGPRPATLHQLQPSDALRDGLPRSNDAKGVPVYLLDPNGFVVLRYPPPFDPAGLRKDLSRLLKVN